MGPLLFGSPSGPESHLLRLVEKADEFRELFQESTESVAGNVMDMAKIMVRVNELTRENARLKQQLAESAATIAELEREND